MISVELNFSRGNLSWEETKADNGVVGEAGHTEDVPDNVGVNQHGTNKVQDEIVDQVS